MLSVSIVKTVSIIYLLSVHVYVFSHGSIFSLAVVPLTPHIVVLFVETQCCGGLPPGQYPKN